MKWIHAGIIAMAAVCFFAGLCFAWWPYGGGTNHPLGNIITGTIEKTGRNTIDIRDEEDKVLKRFIYFGSDVQAGDRVRILYSPRLGTVEQLKKMTPVEYEPQTGQNKGYILKQVPPKESDENKEK